MPCTGNAARQPSAHCRHYSGIATTIGQLVQFGFAVVQVGTAMARQVTHLRIWDDECGCGKGRRCGGGHGCGAVHCYECMDCRPRVYPRGCCQ